MELGEVLNTRRMTRRFAPRPVPPGLLTELLAGALRAPSAGFTQGVDLLALVSSEARSRFWATSTTASWRETSPQARDLIAAPVVVVPVTDPGAYVARYQEPDKRGSSLAGAPAGEWPVPYWLVDASFSVMAILLGATDAGLGALFFRLHQPAAEVLATLGVPPQRETVGAVAIGYPAGERASTSPARRARRVFDEVVHFDHW